MPELAPKRTPPTQTRESIDCPLDRRTEHNIHVYSVQSQEAINDHLQELGNEWSIERSTEAAASVMAIIGILLGALVSQWWLLLPATASVYFLVHAIFRVCPALSLLQGHVSMRTHADIDREKFAMKALRGQDFSSSKDADKTLLAERAITATRQYSSD